MQATPTKLRESHTERRHRVGVSSALQCEIVKKQKNEKKNV